MMKKTFIGVMVMFLVVGLTASAMAGMVGVTIDGQWYDFQTVPTSLGFDIPDQTVGNTNAAVQIVGTVDSDPTIAYGIAVVDFGAPSTFGFTFSTPIVPVPAPTSVRTSIVGGFTDFGGDGVTITALNPPNPLQGGLSYLQDTSLVGSPFVWSVGPSASFGPGPSGALYTYGSYSFGPVLGPVPPVDPLTLSCSLNFSLSGGGDIAVLTGFSEIVTAPVPVPSAMLLLGSGLLGLLGWRRKLN